ncbi:MAG: serine/threonine-protein phosphatase, partial [Candidatus Solibacter usitatus]|nr:serine/threonine-protein phosphatase [Candidatus Solibacter usitatus]
MRLVYLYCLSLPLFAQSVLTVTPTSCVYKEGDDAAWAKPDFDDRDWSPTRPDLERLATSPYLWTRCRLDLRPLARTDPVEVQVQTEGAWQMFVNGEAAGSFGNIATGRFSMDIAQRRPLPKTMADAVIIVVALRLVDRGRSRAGNASKTAVLIRAGAGRTLENEVLRSSLEAIAGRAYSYLLTGIIGAAGLFLFILARADRSRRDLFWLGLSCLGSAVLRGSDIAQALLVPYPDWLFSVLLCTNLPAAAGNTWFYFSISGRQVPLTYRLLVSALGMLHLTPAFASLFGSVPFSQFVVWWTNFAPPARTLRLLVNAAIATAPVAAFWPIWRVARGLRLICGLSLLWMSGLLVVYIAQLPLVPTYLLAPARNFQAVATAPAIIAMFVVLAGRQRRISEERAELQSEMKAAQEMQRLLVPATLDVEPWLAVDVAYIPAKEVGGDFYFCRRTPAGQLIVVGDVSGKGLKAAMMASTVLGALGTEHSANPTEVLALINKVVLRSHAGGFVTCLCALFHSDGTLTFANAGHIAPYLNGVELECPAGLPLGLLADITYDAASYRIASGEAVTLVSDGVVEAAGANGELFGFDRTREISGKSAAQIAETAQAWGQNDDITVVTVRPLWGGSPDPRGGLQTASAGSSKIPAAIIPLLLCLSAPLFAAQPVPVIPAGQTFRLEQPWKVHPGDDRRWAAPDFDDSGWGTQPLCRSPEVAGNLRLPGTGTDRGGFPQMARTDSVAVAARGSGRGLRLESV